MSDSNSNPEYEYAEEPTADTLAPLTGTTVDRATPRPSERFKDYMQARAELDSDGLAYDVAQSQMDKILTAESEQDIWDADQLSMLNAKSLVDVEQAIYSFTVHKSSRQDFETPLGVFVVVHAARMSDGEELVWNTGANLIITKLRAMEARGFVGEGKPLYAVVKATPATNGDVLKLRPVPVRAVQGN
jgi:hypothetical protein